MNATTSSHPGAGHPRTGKPQVDRPETIQGRDPLESFRAPPAAGTLGIWLFTAGLTIAFAWLLIGYVITRSRTPVPGLTVPVWFWFSTFALLVSSVTLHWSYLSAKMGRANVTSQALLLSTLLGGVFVLLQTPALIELIRMHRQSVEPIATGAGGGAAPYMLILVIVSLHGLHTLAGLGRMITLNRSVHHDPSEVYAVAHLKQMCVFWHFLAIVWVVMFGIILWA
jgi:cytochrome c oxidase subunit III